MASEEIDFAYRYPFSEEAKAVIAEKSPKSIEYRYLELGKARLEADIAGKADYFNIALENVKIGYIISYIYARMIASAVGNPYVVSEFAKGEAKRSAAALASEPLVVTERLAKGLGCGLMLNENKEFIMGFSEFLLKKPKGAYFSLANSRLRGGFVVLNATDAVHMLEHIIELKVSSGMPIPKQSLPKEIVEYSKGVEFKAPESKKRGVFQGSTWIDRLLSTPIPDVRHRVVNLVLAPYLVNIKGMEVDEAVKVITAYIEECKKLNPDTNIGETYIKYQCNYAKNKGMRPLSMAKARELLDQFFDFDKRGD